jgi:hypothetical protein
MDLALQTRDYDWCKEIQSLYAEKIEPVQEKPKVSVNKLSTNIEVKNYREIYKDIMSEELFNAYITVKKEIETLSTEEKIHYLRTKSPDWSESQLACALIILETI